jgi:hypothetical protein
MSNQQVNPESQPPFDYLLVMLEDLLRKGLRVMDSRYLLLARKAVLQDTPNGGLYLRDRTLRCIDAELEMRTRSQQW